MVWGTLLAACVVGCPPTYVVYHHGPQMVCLPGAPAPVYVYDVPCAVQTIPSPAYALVPVPVDPPTTTAAVVQDKTMAKGEEQAVTDAVKAEEEDDSVLEDAAFGIPGGMNVGHTLDHLSLGWGVSTIGNGTLYPTPFPNVGGGIGGFGGGSGRNGDPSNASNQGSNWNMINNVLPPINITCPCSSPTPNVTPPTPNEVPEPSSLAAWALLAAAGLYARRRMAS